MLKLEDIHPNAQICGILPHEIVRIVQAEAVGTDALTIYYKDSSGAVKEQMLFRENEATLSLATNGRHWGLDGDGEAFKLALEAWRISQAALFDPLMAIHASNVEPLPHQISAVYETMLPLQPLRFVLADDPGAGKTIMAGLLIKERRGRGERVHRVRQNHHGRSADKRTADARRRAANTHRCPRLAHRTMAGRTVGKIRHPL